MAGLDSSLFWVQAHIGVTEGHSDLRGQRKSISKATLYQKVERNNKEAEFQPGNGFTQKKKI